MRLSVVVCTRNRAHAIIPCLDSIAHSLAQAAPVDAEIVVVDNGSTDNTSSLVNDWATSSAFPLRLLSEPRKGVSRAKNLALRTTQSDLLIFTDDDCRLDTNHVSTALSYDTADTELVLRGGRVELGDPTDLPLSIKTDNVMHRWQKERYPHDFDLNRSFIGANMMMRRALADKVGFFDERLGPGTSLPGSDDIDYIYRSYLAGALIEYVPDMIVFHFHGRKTIEAANKLMRNYAIAQGGRYLKYLFIHPDFSRPGYWAFKKAVRDSISGKDDFMPHTKFSYRNAVACNILGAIKYCAESLGKTK